MDKHHSNSVKTFTGNKPEKINLYTEKLKQISFDKNNFLELSWETFEEFGLGETVEIQ